jgi:UDP-2,3-diacylglucosamine pyrophosphatase LpxH
MILKSPIIIVSDIHLGSEMSRVKKVISLLSSASFESLILNGDILDNPNMKFLHPEHWQFLFLLRKFIDEGKKVVWVQGNHDMFARPFFKSMGLKTAIQLPFEWNGKKCLAIHGHQHDKFLIKNTIMAITMNRSYRIIQKLDGENQIVSRFVKKRYKSWMRVSKRVAKGAAKYAETHGANFVFCGHTHQRMIQKIRGITYVNSGSWADKPCSYVLLTEKEIFLKDFE